MFVSARLIERGVATNAFTGGCTDAAALSNVTWYYNWASTPLTELANCSGRPITNSTLEFVPMVWGSGSVAGIGATLSTLYKSTGTNVGRYLMSFNEPNFASQYMTPAQAATAWQDVLSQLKQYNLLDSLQLGAPSAAPGGSVDPVTWLTEFFTLCSNCTFHFQNVHIYDCNPPYYDTGAFGYWVGAFYAIKNLPLWITEWDCPSNSGSVSLQNETTFLKKALTLLDGADSSIVQRYAWFTARATNVGTLPSLFNSDPGSLTEVGQLYNTYLLNASNPTQPTVPIPTSTTSTTTAPTAATPTTVHNQAARGSTAVATVGILAHVLGVALATCLFSWM